MIFTIFFIIVLFYSIVFHEIAHGYAAYRNEDMTAYNAGRLTLNPLKHIDIFGSILVPLLLFITKSPYLFGWAKPVPYNPSNFRNNKYAELEVASAGVMVNLFLVFISVFTFYILKHFSILNQDIFGLIKLVAQINIFLAFFNLLPFPPADGFSIFSEIYLIIKDFYLKIKNSLSKNKEYRVNYGNFQYVQDRAGIYKLKALFSNPLLMFLIIIVAVNVFTYLAPYILILLNNLFSFQN
jgi:Zn-dependent protease